MLVQTLAALAFLAFLWALFRLAMGLRFARNERERSRRQEQERGRRVVAELPVEGAEVVFLLEENGRFLWGEKSFARDTVVGGRLLVNGAVAREFGSAPSVAVPPEEYEGRERWEVVVYVRGGGSVSIPCGSLREGISRDIGTRVFEAVSSGGRHP